MTKEEFDKWQHDFLNQPFYYVYSIDEYGQVRTEQFKSFESVEAELWNNRYFEFTFLVVVTEILNKQNELKKDEIGRVWQSYKGSPLTQIH